MQQSSLQRVLDEINSLKPEYQITKDSVLLDFGSGTGKVVYHTFLATDIHECWGVEIVKKRNDFAL
jgi:MinD-like ATPase involved in chromosome partitioning or flagellar assembly